jgi:hypothetical protein
MGINLKGAPEARLNRTGRSAGVAHSGEIRQIQEKQPPSLDAHRKFTIIFIE